MIGDFTWTGWDYLGETGIGRVQFSDDKPQFAAPYPWITAWSGDIDITGYRRPASYYRETVFGLRKRPYIAVHRPENHGRTQLPQRWSLDGLNQQLDLERPRGVTDHRRRVLGRRRNRTNRRRHLDRASTAGRLIVTWHGSTRSTRRGSSSRSRTPQTSKQRREVLRTATGAERLPRTDTTDLRRRLRIARVRGDRTTGPGGDAHNELRPRGHCRCRWRRDACSVRQRQTRQHTGVQRDRTSHIRRSCTWRSFGPRMQARSPSESARKASPTRRSAST